MPLTSSPCIVAVVERCGFTWKRKIMNDQTTPETLWVLGFRHHILIDGQQTNGALSVVRIEVPPGMGSPPHLHRNEAETFHVLGGTFDVMQRGVITRVKAGDTLHSPAETWHNFTCVGEEPGLLLVVITPAGVG